MSTGLEFLFILADLSALRCGYAWVTYAALEAQRFWLSAEELQSLF